MVIFHVMVGFFFFFLENSIQVRPFLARGPCWKAQGRSHESGTSSFSVVSVIVTVSEAEARSEFSQLAATCNNHTSTALIQ